MKRNLKVLGLLVVAVCAMSAMMASAAQAVGTFDWELGTSTLTPSAVGIQKFTTTAGTVECNEVKGHVEVSEVNEGGVTSLTATEIKYSNNGKPLCPLKPFGESEIRMNGCHYLFTAGETHATSEGANDGTLGTADIQCPTKTPIEVVAPGGLCTIKIGPQNNLGPITYSNTTAAAPKKDVDLNPLINNITYTHSGFGCGTGGAAAGTYTGEVTIKGENTAGEARGVWVT